MRVVGRWRIPWSIRVWRGKAAPTPTQLGLKLVKRLPKSLTEQFQVIILADTAFGSIEFLHGVRKLKYHAVTGVAVDRKLIDGRVLRHLHIALLVSMKYKFICVHLCPSVVLIS
jgi:predicted DNA repair protein MutK